MNVERKILCDSQIDLFDELRSIRRSYKKVVLTDGHFNVIHPGHVRFLEFARSKGDVLVAMVHGNNMIEDKVKDRFFDETERVKHLASLEYVHKVILINKTTIIDIIKCVKPDFYVKGEEFSRKINIINPIIENVERYGGRLIFSSGEYKDNFHIFVQKRTQDITNERRDLFKEILFKHDITKTRLLNLLDNFHTAKILIIGDTIVDQYVSCEALGMSSEAPVLVVKERESKEFIGGAAIVSRHIKSLGARAHFLSLLGADEPAEYVKKNLEKEDICTRFLIDTDRPTTFKIRYLVDQQKLFRVSRLTEQKIPQKMEEEFIEYIDNCSKDINGIVVSDFSYGLITPQILEYLCHISKKCNIKLFGDTQSSSQVSNVTKFKGYYLIKPNEKEARLALNDKYSGLEKIAGDIIETADAENLILTLGRDGFITFVRTDNDLFRESQHFPALNPHPVDVMGAGDSMLSAFSVSTCAGGNIFEASAISAIVSSLAVEKMGNIPIKLDEVREMIDRL
ncbi:MAG: adenylyltransferase/cytidyltransferase family protein [Oligoflexales bacterium]|nr:adenylyltransferase/cytidyltransferase family protein [Oligoflexales bacterium]